MKRLLILLGALAIIGAAAFYWFSRHEEDPKLVWSGNVDIREVNLAFRVGGRVAQVLVEEGDRIEAGAVLARLDPEPLTRQLAQAEAALAAATASEELLLAGTRDEEVARLKAQAEALRVVLDNAQRNFERQQQLLATNSNSRSAYDDAQAARDQARAELKATQQAYREARNGARPEELAQAAAKRSEAMAQRDIAALHLRDAELTSPSPGTVLTRAVEPGTMVQAGATAITLSLDRPVRIRAYVEEPDLGHAAPGTKVLVSTDARPGEPYTGTIGFVSPRAEFTPKQVETQDLRTTLVYRIRITVDDADGKLRQGMPVTVRPADGQ